MSQGKRNPSQNGRGGGVTGPSERLVELVAGALERAGAERAAYIDLGTGGDAELRREVCSLVEAAGGFLGGTHERDASRAVGAAGMGGSGPSEAPGAVIGPYTLVRSIGEGGFGRVFEAEQSKPVRRTVALKVIKLGMDTRRVVSRFAQERRALALMEHPNIARVLDAGVTETGRPYFVMELVRGEPITAYCDRARLTARERIELFIPVCRAVEHAHQKGVIHRDIKPSNVLVQAVDGRPVPKVIDFGIAKATEADRADQTVYTEQHDAIGTPAYMAPEQAGRGVDDIDTRADIYGLGVLLYELLTGTTPVATMTLLEAGYVEAMRMIVEADPPRPSTRVGGLAGGPTGGLVTTAAARSTDPERLKRALKGDLDWVIMKAIDKDRSRRYGTASDLAADLERHLAGEPVVAAPPSAAYRLKKFVRRNRGPVAAGGVIATALLVGIVSTGIVSIVAVRRAREIEREKVRADAATEAANRRAEEATQAKAVAHRSQSLAEYESYVANLHAAEASLMVGEVHRARKSLEACPERLRGWEWRWLQARRDTSLMRMEVGAEVVCLDVNSKGTMVVAGSANGTATLWEMMTGRLVATMRGHRATVYSAIFSPDESQIATTGEDGRVRLWQSDTGAELCVLLGHGPGVTAAAFNDDGTLLATCGRDATARVWDTTSGAAVRVFDGHTAEVRSVVFDADGRLITGSDDGTVRAWDVETGRGEILLESSIGGAVTRAIPGPDGRLASPQLSGAVRLWKAGTETTLVLRGHTERALWADFHADSGRVVTTSEDKTARIWRTTSGEQVHVLAGHTRSVRQAAFNRDGTRVFTVSFDRTARMWDSGSGRQLAVFDGHEREISRFALNDAGTLLTTASSDGTVRVWAADGSDGSPTLRGHRGEVRMARFSPDGKKVATASLDGTAAVWDATSGRKLAEFVAHAEMLLTLEWSPDGSRLVTGASDRSARVWDAGTGRELGCLMHENTVYRAAYNRQGTAIVTASRDGTARLWDTETFESRTLAGHSKRVNWAEFSPDGTRVATASSDRTARIWDAQTGRELLVLRGHSGTLWRAMFSPDGTTLLTTCSDHIARLWDARTGGAIAVLAGHQHETKAAAFSPDGSLIATASLDGTARVWNGESGSLIAELVGHERTVQDVAFSSDGSRVLTASSDFTARLWDPFTGRELAVLRGHESPTMCARFSPDGTRIVTTSQDATARIWDSVPFRERHPQASASIGEQQ